MKKKKQVCRNDIIGNYHVKIVPKKSKHGRFGVSHWIERFNLKLFKKVKLKVWFSKQNGNVRWQVSFGTILHLTKVINKPGLYLPHNGGNFCSVERTTLLLIHKEIVHKKITELNALYLDINCVLLIYSTTAIKSCLVPLT